MEIAPAPKCRISRFRVFSRFRSSLPAILLLIFITGCAPRTSRVIEPVLIFGEPGRGEGQFNMPRSVDFMRDGSLLIMDRSDRIQRFTRDGQYLSTWHTGPVTHGNPRGLSIAPNGEVYVADTHNSRVLVFSPQGKIVRRWGSYGMRPGQFVWVTDVAVDPHGPVYTCEYGEGRADRIQKFDTQGRFVLQLARFGSAPGEVQRPEGLALDRQGDLFVADGVNHRVQEFAPDGRLLAVIGGLGSAPGQLRYPYDVALDRAGRLYVCEFGNHRISVFRRSGVQAFGRSGGIHRDGQDGQDREGPDNNRDPVHPGNPVHPVNAGADPERLNARTPERLNAPWRFITSWGRPGRRPGEFNHPWGVGVDADGFVYVADTYNYRVQKFAPLPP